MLLPPEQLDRDKRITFTLKLTGCQIRTAHPYSVIVQKKIASFITVVFDMNMLVLFRVLTSSVGDFLCTKTSHLMNFTIRSECLVEIRADLHWNNGILYQFLIALRISIYKIHTNFGGFQLVDLIITELKSHMTC